MFEELFITQLSKKYPAYLKAVILGEPFVPITFRGEIKKPETNRELSDILIPAYTKHEKKEDRLGWTIKWVNWEDRSKRFRPQPWPAKFTVTTEADFLYLLKKEKEMICFKKQLQQLLGWKKEVISWLAAKPARVLDLKAVWNDICAVVDYVLKEKDLSNHYLTTLKVPVHTKFIKDNKSPILSLLKHLDPVRFPKAIIDIEDALGVKKAPHLRRLRWLDTSLADTHTQGVEMLGYTRETLSALDWKTEEIWLVENKDNLHLLPPRKNALAIFGEGRAILEPGFLPADQHNRLFYWGDLDIEGLYILHLLRKQYPHVQSVLMDEKTVVHHHQEMRTIDQKTLIGLEELSTEEQAAYELLARHGAANQTGRIEQQQLEQEYVQTYLQQIP